jgi:hypothetical protein
METCKDPGASQRRQEGDARIKPIDGPTIAGMFTRLYDMNEEMKSRLKQIVIPGK